MDICSRNAQHLMTFNVATSMNRESLVLKSRVGLTGVPLLSRTRERDELITLAREAHKDTFTFAHSTPRASLPVLWAQGKVKAADGGLIDWLPLFPNA